MVEVFVNKKKRKEKKKRSMVYELFDRILEMGDFSY